MNGTLKSKHGCWTCRLRRKKCDEKQPFCSTCESLTITCHGYGNKPDWMDNGDREKAMANSIKKIVKKTSRHKGRLGLSMGRFQVRSKSQTDEVMNDGGLAGAVRIAPKPTSTADPNAEITPPSTESASPAVISDTIHRLSPDSTGSSPPQDALSWLSAIKNDEAVLLMHFIDTVFPLQYPMYRPNIVEGGRGWLLSLLSSTKPLYHASLALSAYHRGTVLLAASHRAGSTSSTVSQERHLAICLSEFQQAIKNVSHWVSKTCPSNSLGLMACVLQLLFFELFAGHSDAWQVHFRASTDIFCKGYWNQAMELGLVDSPEKFFDGKTTLVIHEGRSPPEESGIFLFLSGVTIWLDVVFSITTGKSPRLLSFHPHAVSCSSAIKLENIMGCKNWAILQIGRISALHDSKAEAVRQGCFDPIEFEDRAQNIRQELQSGLTEYSLAALELSSHSISTTPALLNPDIYIITRLFTLAASLYLFLVVRAYQLKTQEMRTLILDSMLTLRTKMPANMIHVIICPLYIIGGVARQDDKDLFRQVFSSPPITDPSLEHRSKILPVLEEIWRMRDSTGWTWEDTLRLSGRNLLLL